MKKSDVKALPSMPLQSPTFPRGPYRFFNRKYMVIHYKSDAALIREALPEPLEPAGDTVAVQWVDMPDGEGFGRGSIVVGTAVLAPVGRGKRLGDEGAGGKIDEAGVVHGLRFWQCLNANEGETD